MIALVTGGQLICVTCITIYNFLSDLVIDSDQGQT